MKRFIKAVLFAWQGVRQFYIGERNAKIQTIMGILAITLGLAVSISPYQWMFVLFCIALVISLEMINSAIERYCDLVTIDYNPAIKIIKDVAAGAVLVASMISLIIGLIIFIPAIVEFLNQFV